MEQKLLEVYNTVCDTNDKIITSGEKVQASCIIFYNGEQKAYNFEVTEKTKNIIAEKLKSRILQHGAQGYILVMDTITQKKDQKTNMTLRGQCITRTLYTPQERIGEYVWYNNKEILVKDRVEGRNKIYDLWDAWNQGEIQISKKIDQKDFMRKWKL